MENVNCKKDLKFFRIKICIASCIVVASASFRFDSINKAVSFSSSRCRYFLGFESFTGVFAVASLMVGAVRLRFLPDPVTVFEVVNGTRIETIKAIAGPIDFGYEVSPVMLTTALAMAVGMFQVSNS